MLKSEVLDASMFSIAASASGSALKMSVMVTMISPDDKRLLELGVIEMIASDAFGNNLRTFNLKAV